MKELSKFKVGDRVRVKESYIPKTNKPEEWINKSYIITKIGINGIIYINHPEYPSWSEGEKLLELVKEAIDYKDTYVRVCSEEENKRAIEFYKDKGKVHYGYRVTPNGCYVGGMKDNEEYSLLDEPYLTGTKDITEEVLGKKEEKPTNPKFIPVELKPEDYTYANIARTKQPRKLIDFSGWLGGLSGVSPTRVIIDDPCTEIPPFNNLPTKKMSTLRNNIRDRFFKKEESKLADLIEEVEEGFEPVIGLYNRLDKLTDKQEDLVKELDRAVELKDKSAIKEAKKKLEEFKKETLEDKLFEQLITISKKLVK